MAVFQTVLWGIAAISVVLGFWFLQKPKNTIEMQIGFYRLINWRMDPLNWDLEIRNTRIMGVTTLISGAAMVGVLLQY